MPIFMPLLSGITAALTVVLTYETGKHAKRKFDKKALRGHKKHTT